MIEDIYFKQHGDKNDYLVILLPGRGGHGANIVGNYHSYCVMPNTVYVGITPTNYEWYPQPYSPWNQEEAVRGIPRSRKLLKLIIENLHKQLQVPPSKTVIGGFSAGGVMALDYLAHSSNEYLLGVCHNGAILDTDNLQNCTNETPLLVFHNQDDFCFDWHERYLPMKYALEARNYNTCFVERHSGGHAITRNSLFSVCSVLNQLNVPAEFSAYPS